MLQERCRDAAGREVNLNLVCAFVSSLEQQKLRRSDASIMVAIKTLQFMQSSRWEVRLVRSALAYTRLD